jgi:hypothetical protein
MLWTGAIAVVPGPATAISLFYDFEFLAEGTAKGSGWLEISQETLGLGADVSLLNPEAAAGDLFVPMGALLDLQFSVEISRGGSEPPETRTYDLLGHFPDTDGVEGVLFSADGDFLQFLDARTELPPDPDPLASGMIVFCDRAAPCGSTNAHLRFLDDEAGMWIGGALGLGGNQTGTFTVSRRIGEAIPEPDSTALFLAGVALIALALQRRSAASMRAGAETCHPTPPHV